MKIYRVKKDWSYVIGNGGVGFIMKYKQGDLFFKPTDESKYKTIGPDYFPQNGSYAVSEREDFKFVDEYFELIEETDKPKEYFIDKIYTQFQVDEISSINKFSKQYIKSDLDPERVEELYLEITGKRVLPKKEIHKLDAFFERDENGNIALYYYYPIQESINKENND